MVGVPTDEPTFSAAAGFSLGTVGEYDAVILFWAGSL